MPAPMVVPPVVLPGPTVAPRAYGLLATARVIDSPVPDPNEDPTPAVPALGETNGAAQRGVVLLNDPCAPALTTVADCPTPATDPLPTSNNGNNSTGSPFTVWGFHRCAPIGISEERAHDRALAHLLRGEGRAVERAFWTGELGNVPHLADSTLTPLNPQNGVAVDPVSGLALLEDFLAGCYPGQGMIHVPAGSVPVLSNHHDLVADGPILRTKSYTPVVAGAGYANTGPDGQLAPAGRAWWYATGTPTIWRGSEPDPVIGTGYQQWLDRANNDAVVFAAREYTIAIDCCLAAVLVYTGEN